jgi:nicotinamidase-related amidase
MKRALLVIDVQKIYTDKTSEYYVENQAEIITNINRLIEKYEKDSLIVYIAHKNKFDGSDSGRMYDFAGDCGDVEFVEGSASVEYDSKLKLKKGEHIVKHKYDSFVGTKLYEVLKKNEIEKVIVVGFMTNFCCESTARSAHDLDFYVDFVKDATGTPGTAECAPEMLIETTCSNISAGFGKVVTTEDLLKIM